MQKTIMGEVLNQKNSTLYKISLSRRKVSVTDYFLEIASFVISTSWMLYAYIYSSDRSVRIFTILNLCLTIMVKVSLRIYFYSDLSKNKESLKFRVFSCIFIFIFYLSWILVIITFIVVPNIDLKNNKLDSLSGIIILATGLILMLLGILDRTIWFMMDKIKE